MQELSHIILMETLSGVVEGDIEAFGDSINRIQGAGFKRREIALQTPETIQIIELMHENTCGAGLSSFGPEVYGITDRMRYRARGAGISGWDDPRQVRNCLCKEFGC